MIKAICKDCEHHSEGVVYDQDGSFVIKGLYYPFEY